MWNRLTPEQLEGLSKRFWAKVEVKEYKDHWDWKGATLDGRYGRIRVPWKKHFELAHRVAWILTRGKGVILPRTTLVRHLCDITLCVNPYHLTTGTDRDNKDDLVAAHAAERQAEEMLRKIVGDEPLGEE